MTLIGLWLVFGYYLCGCVWILWKHRDIWRRK